VDKEHHIQEEVTLVLMVVTLYLVHHLYLLIKHLLVEVVVEDQDQDLTMQEDLVVHRVVDLMVKHQFQEQLLQDIQVEMIKYLLLLDGVMLVVPVFLENHIQKVVEVVAQGALVELEEEIQEEMVVQVLHIQSADHQ
tara:strand:- start:2 stop:412 length:411 start_codon:yes stop_codon:yes gene_type:complete